MGTVALLATHADTAMLGTSILPPSTPVRAMPDRSGRDVARELRGRPLLRYLDDDRVDERAHPGPVFVCPTPYAAADVAVYLALPQAWPARRHVLLLDARCIPVVRGPRWCTLGPGIEYVLPHGYDEDALVGPGTAVPLR